MFGQKNVTLIGFVNPISMRPFRMLLSAFCIFNAAMVYGAGPFGADNGWAVDNNSNVLVTSAVAAQMSAGETGWLRIEMRLFGSHTHWDAGILSLYDSAVNNARTAGIEVVLLIDGGSWPGGQSAWCANNSENNSGANGDNPFVEDYATNAVMPIVQHFHDRVKYYELWNEPNCWSSNPSNGVYTGCTYIYPSNYGWLLTRSWAAVHASLAFQDVTLFFGGVFGHNIGGVSSYANAGAQYIDDTYSTGTNVHKGASFNYAKTNFNTYPLDGIGEHIYLSTGGTVASNTFRQYEDWVHQACTKYEGSSTTKKTYITEFGWQTTNASNANGVSTAVQDTNLTTAFSAIRATPYVKMAIWFQWKDNPAGSLWYGVVDSAGNPKPSYADYQQFERFEGRFSNGFTNSNIQSYFYSLGQPVLGNAFDNGHSASVYAFLDGHAQDFEGGSHRSLTIVTSTNGTFEINDLNGFWSFYTTNNGPDRIGFPVGNAFAFGGGTRQNFTFGSLNASGGVVSWIPIQPVLFGNGQRVLSWTGYYSLQSATNISGPFTDIVGATSPYTNQGGSYSLYFRLRH